MKAIPAYKDCLSPLQIQRVRGDSEHVFVRYEDKLYVINLNNNTRMFIRTGRVCEVFHNGLYMVTDVNK
jgi:hypothetical protein